MNFSRRQNLRHVGALLAAAASASMTSLAQARTAAPNAKEAKDIAPMSLEVQPMRAVVWQDFLGVNAALQSLTPEAANAQIERLKALGLNWVRVGLQWVQLEPESGQMQWDAADRVMGLIKQAGLHSITHVSRTPRFASPVHKGVAYFDRYPPRNPLEFAERMKTLAQRYPQVDVWQVWNEPNMPANWLPRIDPEAYGRVLRPAVAALREVAPNKPVAAAGMAHFSQMAGRDDDGLMLEHLSKQAVWDANLIACYHPYTALPEGGADGAREMLMNMDYIHKGLKEAGAKRIWATEWGWSSFDGPVDEEQGLIGESGQAAFTLKRLALMATQDFERIFLSSLADQDDVKLTPRERRYGLLHADGSPKPVYQALQRFLAICGPSLEPTTTMRIQGGLPAGLVSVQWKRPDGKRVWMTWAHKPMSVRLPGIKSGVWHQPVQGTQHDVLATDSKGLKLNVGTDLQVLVWG